MNKKYLFSLAYVVFNFALTGCQKGINNAVLLSEKNGRCFYSCNMNESKCLPSTLLLSDIADEPKIVFFENSPESIFGFWRCVISDNYIGICTENSKFQLFDHNGTYIRSIGKVGHGPGEYITIYGSCIDEKNGFIYLADMMTRKLLKYTINGDFIGWINQRPLSKSSLRCDEEGSLEVINIPMTADDFQFLIIPPDTEPMYFPSAINVPVKDERGNFIGFNHELWSFNNTSDLSYQISCSDTLYVFNSRIGENIPLVTAKFGDYFPFYNDINKYYLISFYSEPDTNEIWWLKKDDGELGRGKLINDYLFGLEISDACFKFRDGWYCEFFESFDLITQIEEIEKRGTLNPKEQTRAKQLKEKVQNAEQGVMLIGQIK